MSNLDCSAALQPCNCTSSQVCIQIGRSSTECAKNTCVDKGTSGGNGKGGSSSVGAVAEQAVGGVIGGLVVIVLAYFIWRRRRAAKGYSTSSGPGFSLFNRAQSSNHARNNGNNGLRNFKMGGGGGGGGGGSEEKQPHSASTPGAGKTYNPSPLRNVTSPPGPGEEDAQSIKRQSLRFDPSNNGTRTSRRSLSGTGGLPSDGGNNPFADPSDEDSRLVDDSIQQDRNNNNNNRESAATVSEFSYRSSHSTNIIPIAYIPAHSSQNSTIDMHHHHRDSRRPHSMSPTTIAGGGANVNNRASNMMGDRRLSGAPLSVSRSSRASVPLSLRSNSTGNMHDSMHGATFSRLFDRRSSTLGAAGAAALNGFKNGNNGGGDPNSPGMLEIIAPNMGATSPPAINTPTMTKDGRPIRPPRAPGLDLKLPTPESISPPPPTSPGAGFPWTTANSSQRGTLASSSSALNSPASGGSLAISPGGQSQHQQSFAAMQAALVNNKNAGGNPQQRETLLSPTYGMNHPGRSSAYSTFSQSTDNSGSHMSYILEAPQIVTPVSAGHVQVQTLTRAAAKAVKLPHSNSGNSLSTGLASPGSSMQQQHLASSPLARGQSSSPLSDNPFDDDAAVRIAMPSPGSNESPSLPLTPTFGGATALPSPDQRDSNMIPQGGLRMSMATTNTRRDSDLSIFTSSEVHNDEGGVKRTARNSFASSFASVHQGSSSSSSGQTGQQGRAPSPSSFAGTTGHSNKSNAPSVHSYQSADEVILAPPNRPFVSNDNNGGDSRHTSAALSMRSGYGSVLDGIPFNLSLSPEARHSQASETGGPHMSVPFTFGSGVPLQQGRRPSDAGTMAGMRDSSVTYRTSVASSSAHGHLDKRDTAYSLASEWNGAFAGMPIQMGNIAEEAVPDVPSMYRQSTASNGADNGAVTQAKKDGKEESTAGEVRDDRYSSDSLALAAAVARQFDEAS